MFDLLDDKNGVGVVHFNDEKLFAPLGHLVHGLKKTRIVTIGFDIQVLMAALVCMCESLYNYFFIFHSTLKGPFPFCPFLHFPLSHFKLLVNSNSSFYPFLCFA